MSTKQAHSTSEHIIPLKTYLGIGLALLILTGITVAVSLVHLGPFNMVVALLIATTKATLVALVFMHLKYDNKLFATVFTISLLFVSVFIILTMFDTETRGDIYDIKSKPIRDAKIYQQAP